MYESLTLNTVFRSTFIVVGVSQYHSLIRKFELVQFLFKYIQQ